MRISLPTGCLSGRGFALSGWGFGLVPGDCWGSAQGAMRGVLQGAWGEGSQ